MRLEEKKLLRMIVTENEWAKNYDNRKEILIKNGFNLALGTVNVHHLLFGEIWIEQEFDIIK